MNQVFDTLDSTQKRRFFNAVISAVILLALFLGVKVLNTIKEYSYIGSGVYPTNTITVTGLGEVFSIPDTASFSFSVNEEGKTVKDAQDKASKKMNAIIEALGSMNIDDKDIKTTGYNSGPKYEWRYEACPANSYCPPGKNILVGYEVNQIITVKIREIDDAGNVLTKVGGLGATNISSLDFVVDDLDAVKAEARNLAIANAKEKAKALSKALDIKLVKIVNFSDSGDYPPPTYFGLGAMEAKGMSVDTVAVAPALPAGENKIVSNVSIIYEVR
jgi:uncharacterized protein YggE